MKSNLLYIALLAILFVGLVSTQEMLRNDQTQHQVIDVQEEDNQDPFKKRPSHPEKKKHRRDVDSDEFPSLQEAKQQWGIYKPFPKQGDDDYIQDRKARSKRDLKDINMLLVWGMVAGSIFLAIVLAKTCMKKRGRREMRRMNMIPPQLRVMNQFVRQPQVQQPVYYIPQQQCQSETLAQSNTIDQKIKRTQLQLIKLKQLQQQQLRKEFERKKNQEEQAKIQMINLQRHQNQQFYQQQQTRNNAHLRYGPAIYNVNQQRPINHGKVSYEYVQSQNQMSRQQPFQVQGIEEIPRKRVNSFKTQNSERPIMNQNDIKYRNGIPIGKPIKHDNDSSFASEYPQV